MLSRRENGWNGKPKRKRENVRRGSARKQSIRPERERGSTGRGGKKSNVEKEGSHRNFSGSEGKKKKGVFLGSEDAIDARRSALLDRPKDFLYAEARGHGPGEGANQGKREKGIVWREKGGGEKEFYQIRSLGKQTLCG